MLRASACSEAVPGKVDGVVIVTAMLTSSVRGANTALDMGDMKPLREHVVTMLVLLMEHSPVKLYTLFRQIRLVFELLLPSKQRSPLCIQVSAYYPRGRWRAAVPCELAPRTRIPKGELHAVLKYGFFLVGSELVPVTRRWRVNTDHTKLISCR